MFTSQEVGIVYVDEIDKVCSEGGGRTSSFRPAAELQLGCSHEDVV